MGDKKSSKRKSSSSKSKNAEQLTENQHNHSNHWTLDAVTQFETNQDPVRNNEEEEQDVDDSPTFEFCLDGSINPRHSMLMKQSSLLLECIFGDNVRAAADNQRTEKEENNQPQQIKTPLLCTSLLCVKNGKIKEVKSFIARTRD
jgi:hypothetical protein